MELSDIIEIRISGNEIMPANVKAGEIADILNSVEDMIETVITADNPSITREDIIVGLVNILPGSIRLQFTSQTPDFVLPAFEKVSTAVANNDYKGVPSQAKHAIENIYSFTQKKNCSTEFITRNGKEKVLAMITPDMEMASIPLISGETVIYGRIIRVGGRTPRAMVETIDGLTVYCDSQTKIAKQLGEKLYQNVGLYGLAQWDAESLSLEEFRIEGISSYENKAITHSIEELSEIAGKYYSEVEDVDDYISKMRSGEWVG